ncbi:hypothetical protein CFOL_v3_16875 [Cephalotus follicularis]|uniref:Uncharacterized protein n=1 Tax=Cephalotus follicularis TaxID=3775 RepID=A0A1Q3BZS2_CEPFO|nr:hypothetical protein CFOL_v3_16875 [Cephalotus follicularis]
MMFPSEAGDREMKEISLGAGAIRARNVTLSPVSSIDSRSQSLGNLSITPPVACQSQSRNLVQLFMISILTSKFSLHTQLQICMLSMYFTCSTAVVTIAAYGLKVFLIVPCLRQAEKTYCG